MQINEINSRGYSSDKIIIMILIILVNRWRMHQVDAQQAGRRHKRRAANTDVNISNSCEAKYKKYESVSLKLKHKSGSFLHTL